MYSILLITLGIIRKTLLLMDNSEVALQCTACITCIIRECGSTLYVGMPRKQNGRPIHCIVKSSPQNAAIGKF